MKNTLLRIVLPVVLVVIAVLCFIFIPSKDNAPVSEESGYKKAEGSLFGSQYNILYDSEQNLNEAIEKQLQDLDASVSTFNENSIISRINRNEAYDTDEYIERMFEVAEQTSLVSDGAFDITVGPLIKAWGDSFDNNTELSDSEVNELRQYVGFANINISNHRFEKFHPDILINAAALTKGEACDYVAKLLQENGVENYYINIGGKLECKGHDQNGELWKVNIDDPAEDHKGEVLETIITDNLCMTASKSRREYVKDGVTHRSYTIDPSTGYPVDRDVQLAVVTAPTCIQADALATACMVMGKEQAMSVISAMEGVDCYIVYKAENGKNAVMMTDGMKKILNK